MSDKRIYYRELDGYTLSIIRRTYGGLGWSNEGPESVIFSQNSEGRKMMKIEWKDDSDQSRTFASFKTAEDVTKFIQRKDEFDA